MQVVWRRFCCFFFPYSLDFTSLTYFCMLQKVTALEFNFRNCEDGSVKLSIQKYSFFSLFFFFSFFKGIFCLSYSGRQFECLLFLQHIVIQSMDRSRAASASYPGLQTALP